MALKQAQEDPFNYWGNKFAPSPNPMLFELGLARHLRISSSSTAQLVLQFGS